MGIFRDLIDKPINGIAVATTPPANQVSDVEIRAHLMERAEEISEAWRAVAFYHAETLRWPRMDLKPSRTGYIGNGEYIWRRYLHHAPAAELKYRVVPALKLMIEEIGTP